MRPKQALIKKADPKARITKNRVKQAQLYQNWRVWSCGEAYTFNAVYSSLRRTRLTYKKNNGHRLTSNFFYLISLCRDYMSRHNTDSFTMKDLSAWAIPMGLLTASYKYKQHYRRHMLVPMLNSHLLNEVSKGRYALSNRSKHIWGQFEKYMREYFENDLLQPSRTSHPTKPVD